MLIKRHRGISAHLGVTSEKQIHIQSLCTASGWKKNTVNFVLERDVVVFYSKMLKKKKKGSKDPVWEPQHPRFIKKEIFNSPVKAKIFTASIKPRLAGQKAFLGKYKRSMNTIFVAFLLKIIINRPTEKKVLLFHENYDYTVHKNY